MLYVFKNAIPWHSMPREFGSPTTVYSTFMRWCRRGWLRWFRGLQQCVATHQPFHGKTYTSCFIVISDRCSYYYGAHDMNSRISSDTTAPTTPV